MPGGENLTMLESRVSIETLRLVRVCVQLPTPAIELDRQNRVMTPKTVTKFLQIFFRAILPLSLDPAAVPIATAIASATRIRGCHERFAWRLPTEVPTFTIR